jgi:two-component system, chemotaxis family, chemotaxis protein CheY
MILKKFLSQYGDCDVVVDGRQAVEAVKNARQERRSYDLVCVDLGMPVMDGQQTIREIRKQEGESRALRATKIIVMTAASDMDNITNALIGKCSSYLVKPIDTGRLRGELQELGLIK